MPTPCCLFKLFGGKLLPADLHCIRREWVSTQWSCTLWDIYHQNKNARLFLFHFPAVQSKLVHKGAHCWGERSGHSLRTRYACVGFSLKQSTWLVYSLFFPFKSFDICYMTAAFTNCSLLALERQHVKCCRMCPYHHNISWWCMNLSQLLIFGCCNMCQMQTQTPISISLDLYMFVIIISRWCLY